MKILHVVMLFFLTISAPVIAQPKDELGTVMQYLSTHNRIKELRTSAIKCTLEARLMQQQLHKQGAPQREWEQLKRSCQEVLHNIDQIESEAFASCINNIDTEDDKLCYEHLVDN